MKRSHRSSSPRAIRLIALALCYALIITTAFLPLSPSVIADARGSNRAAPSSSSLFVQSPGLFGAPGRWLGSLMTLFQGGGGLPSVPGPNLPDLDAARQVQAAESEALPPIASSQPNPDICPNCEPGNHPPISNPGGPYFGSANQAIEFNGLGSRDVDPGDGISDYAWTFGDGPTIVHGATPSHTYQSAGLYTVSLTVTDQHDATRTASTTASVTAGPTPTPTPSASPTPSPSPAQTNAATFVSQSVPAAMGGGERYSVSVTMRNTGDTTWSAAHLYRLGSQNAQDNSNWGRSRVYLPADVLPGAEVTFNFIVKAPAKHLGQVSVHFQWQMVQDGVEWFGQTHDDVVTVTTSQEIPIGDLHPDNLATARLDPRNRTGEPGEDLVSGNYNWMLNVLNLSGRAGLNLNLPLSYNSLATWTKLESRGTSMTFDAERGFPSVGFRLGFPSIRGPFSNNQTNKSAYMLNTPAGGHIELRQVDSSSVYEAADSSYLQLLDGGNGGLLLRNPDGSQLAYLLINGEYRCTEIKDRNGNYITIKYDPINGTANPGYVSAVVDTLNRTIDFNYDDNLRLRSITQMRGGQAHAWATFGYDDREVRTNFAEGEEDPFGTIGAGVGGIDVLGLPENNTVSVLTQVSLDDGSRYNFEYTGWGQVNKITHHAADSTPGSPHPLSYVSYDLPPDRGDPQSDCPRFTQRQDWAENWNGNDPVTTTFDFDHDGQWGQVTAPDGTVYKEFFTRDYNNWRRGLVSRTEIYSPDDKDAPAKTTITDWTQDDTSVGYPLNPRATGTTISDSNGNRRRITIDYGSFGLPSDVFDWGPSGTDGWTLLRRTHTDFELSSAYLNLHILGLTRQQFLFGAEDNGQRLYSKVSYEYDAGGEFLQDQGNPVQHDAAHGLWLVQGRGNVTKVRRWDVNYETDIGQSTASTVGYNTTGSAIFSRDPLGHQTTINYNDSFSTNGVNVTAFYFTTLAYPTRVTDPDNFSSTLKYNYDLGVVTRQQDPKGAAETTEYDSAGRTKRVTNLVNGAYTRFVYPTSQTIVNKFSTIQEGQGEAYSATIFDGAGRVRAVAGDFPNSTGHYSGQFTLYDLMGRAIQQTNPTEMTHAWAAAGDDNAGWVSSSQTYDWKGRPLVTTNQDGITKEASYGGCGCAGGEVVTLTDEGTLVAGDSKKRQQKIYSDVLGRTVKTEVLNWDGAGPFGTGGTVYSTIVNTYDARDQITLVRQYQGTSTSNVYQDTTMTYDGYGRLKTKHAPEQKADPSNAASTDHTSWEYNDDDTLHKMIDARGASQTFGYNARDFVNSISYAAPSGSSIPVPASVAMDYDAAGNRLWTTDGLGRVDYDYDTQSRLNSEVRHFNALEASSTGGDYPLTYEYNLSGQLKKITDPFNAQVGYSRDTAGRTIAVTGSGFGDVSSYASNFEYRAWGALKHLTYGNTRSLNASYNSRLQTTHYEVTTVANFPSGPKVVSLNYQRYPDGRVSYSHDLLNQHFDRAYSYDHSGQMTQALSGAEARGEAATDDRPYKQNFTFDVWSNMTGRTGKHWSHHPNDFSATYVDNRIPGLSYDADGRAKVSNSVTSVFDAAGLLIQTTGPTRRNNPPLTLNQEFDGDGQKTKKTENGYSSYLLRSTVVGGEVVSEIYGTPGDANLGQKQKGYVYANGIALAEQNTFLNVAFYKHYDPSRAEEGVSYQHPDGSVIWGRTQLDPLQDDVGEEDPYLPEPGGGDPPDLNYPVFGDPTDFAHGCTVDGQPVMCTFAFEYKKSGGLGRLAADGPIGFALHEGLHWLTSGGLLRAGVGSTPLLGRFCVSVSSSLGDDGSGPECSTDIVGFTSDADMGATVTPRALIPQNPGLTQQQTNARNNLGECSVHALLDTLSYSEGADYNTVVKGTVIRSPNNPSLVGQRNVTITDFSQHPNILVNVGPGLNSTAAGRYQFLSRTWNGLGLPNFQPFNQDVGAAMLMQRRGMITPLLNGDVEQAIMNGNAEWASLPGSPYGQGTRSMNSLKKVYNQSFLNCVQAMHEIHQGLRDNNGV